MQFKLNSVVQFYMNLFSWYWIYDPRRRRRRRRWWSYQVITQCSLSFTIPLLFFSCVEKKRTYFSQSFLSYLCIYSYWCVSIMWPQHCFEILLNDRSCVRTEKKHTLHYLSDTQYSWNINMNILYILYNIIRCVGTVWLLYNHFYFYCE